MTIEFRDHERPSQTTRTVRAATGIEEIDQSLQVATQWVDALIFRLNVSAREAMTALSAMLQAIRDQLPVEQGTRFAATLPMPLQGAYYEGWRPTALKPAPTRPEFLERIGATTLRDANIPVERAVKAAMEVISRKVPAAEMAEVVPALPQDLSQLWPDQQPPYTDLRVVRPLEHNLAPPPTPARGAKSIRHARNRSGPTAPPTKTKGHSRTVRH